MSVPPGWNLLLWKEIDEDNGDEGIPFQSYSDIDVNRNYVDINNSVPTKVEKSTDYETNHDLGITELLAQAFSVVEAITGHEHWNIDSKEAKVLKNLCKIPALEKYLRKLGLYGCVLGLFGITLRKVKKEIQLKKEPKENNKSAQV